MIIAAAAAGVAGAGTPGPVEPVDSQAVVGFVACPVYRDTDAGPKSGCWLATDRATGRQYDVSRALTKPMIGREVLVEGVAGGTSSACGGTLVEPVHVSVLETTCPRHMLPAEGFPGNRFALPAQVMQPTDVPRPVLEPPYDTRRFDIWFDFGSSFLRYQYSELVLEGAALYAVASEAPVAVTGFADTSGFDTLSRHLAEDITLARDRAEQVAESLRRLGVEADRISVSWRGDPAPQGGLVQPSLRRVEILVKPAPSH